MFEKYFKRNLNLFIYFALNYIFLEFSNYFDAFISKNIFFFKKKYYFNAFPNKKHFKK